MIEMREHVDGDFAHGAEFTGVARDALGLGTFIKNGCEVTEGTGDYEVDISAGTAFINGASVAVGGDTKVISSEDTFTRRYDLLTVDGTGNVNVTEGTADSTAPPIPEDEAVIGIIKIDKDVTGIGSGDIKDVRILVNIVLPDAQIPQEHGNAAHNPNFATEANFNNHSARHENGGADKINVAGLSGELSDAQPPKTHSNTAHNPNFATEASFNNHSARHESGGADEIDVGGLSGVLEPWQLPVKPSDTWRHIIDDDQPITSSDWVKLAQFDFQQQIKNFRVYYRLSASFEEPSIESADLRLTWNGSVIAGSQITLESSGSVDNTKDLEFTTAGRLAVEGRATLTSGSTAALKSPFQVGYDFDDDVVREVDVWTLE